MRREGINQKEQAIVRFKLGKVESFDRNANEAFDISGETGDVRKILQVMVFALT